MPGGNPRPERFASLASSPRSSATRLSTDARIVRMAAHATWSPMTTRRRWALTFVTIVGLAGSFAASSFPAPGQTVDPVTSCRPHRPPGNGRRSRHPLPVRTVGWSNTAVRAAGRGNDNCRRRRRRRHRSRWDHRGGHVHTRSRGRATACGARRRTLGIHRCRMRRRRGRRRRAERDRDDHARARRGRDMRRHRHVGRRCRDGVADNGARNDTTNPPISTAPAHADPDG